VLGVSLLDKGASAIEPTTKIMAMWIMMSLGTQ
jgi:hypothetical protein